MSGFVNDSSNTVTEDPEELRRIRIFLAWLEENGALFPKLSWPRNDTKSGIRGVIANEDIPTEDRSMLQIPIHLMMTPVRAIKDSVYGEILKSRTQDLLYGDFLLAIYIMIELVRGKDSFFYPYLSILPTPSCLSEWTEEELSLLQDDRIYIRAKNKKKFLQLSYDRIVRTLSEENPELFPLQEFTFTRFCLAWNTIQARAFGRRLPWTALVPFADCLNHANVQTKYDYNIDSNGMFRLFPTGQNAYLQGEEVFNSYGRRNNENLLLEYGFAMMDNEWDEVEIALGISPVDSAGKTDCYYSEKRSILSYFGYSHSKIFLCSRYYLPIQTLGYLRITLAPDSLMEAWIKRQSETESKEESSIAEELETQLQPVVEGSLISRLQRLKQQKSANEISNPYSNSDLPGYSAHSQNSRNPEDYQMFRKCFSLEHELLLLHHLSYEIEKKLSQFPTGAEYDELLVELGSKSSILNDRQKLRNAFLREIVYYLQDKYDLENDIQDETMAPASLQERLVLSINANQSLSLELEKCDERIVKMIDALSTPPITIDNNGWNALVYRLTRKRVYQEMFKHLEIVKQYISELMIVKKGITENSSP